VTNTVDQTPVRPGTTVADPHSATPASAPSLSNKAFLAAPTAESVVSGRPARSPAGRRRWLNRRAILWPGGCSLLCLLLRLPFIATPLGIDEGGDAFIAQHWANTHGSVYGAYWLDRPPLLLLLYKVGLIGGTLGIRIMGSVVAVAIVATVMAAARRLSNDKAARISGLTAAILLSAVSMGAVFTDSELLAALPAALSVLMLLISSRSARPLRWLVAAGLFAAAAVLIKQSSVDAFAAGIAYLAGSLLVRKSTGIRISWPLSYLAGFSVPLIAAGGWAYVYSTNFRQFLYAVIGFRVDGLRVLQHSTAPPIHMLIHHGLPILIASGCGLLLPWAASHIWTMRRQIPMAAAFAGFLAGGMFGIVGGGQYFPHYFIQIIPVLSILAGCAIARAQRRYLTHFTIYALVLLGVLNLGFGMALAKAHPPQVTGLAITRFLHANATQGDSLYVLYARANVLYYAGMPSPYPYNWSLMDRAIADAEPRLRSMLVSPARRPTWIVEWQTPTSLGLDRSGETTALLARNYVAVGGICGKRVLVRRDRKPAHIRQVPADCSHLHLPPELVVLLGNVPINDVDSVDYFWS